MRSTPDKTETNETTGTTLKPPTKNYTKPAPKTEALEPKRHKTISIESVELFKLLVRLRMEDKARTTQTDDDMTNDALVLLTFEDGSKVSGSVEEIEAKASFTELSAYVANQVMSRKTVGG